MIRPCICLFNLSKMKCNVCQGTSFTEDCGLRTCDGCGTEVENFVTFETQIGSLNCSQRIRLVRENIKTDQEQETKLKACETYNIILRAWTKILLSLGASHRFEEIIFELWIRYLQCAKLAFLQNDDSQDTHNSRDSEIHMLQRKMYCYFPSATKVQESRIPSVFNLSSMENMKYAYSPDNITLAKVLSLVYLALVLAEEPILLMDLIRWCREGHIPYFSVHNLLPPGCKSEVSRIPVGIRYENIKDYSINLAMYLNIIYFPVPQYSNVIERVRKLLRLPDYVGEKALKLMKKLLDSKFVDGVPVLAIETFAIASIVVVLKDHLGLNDCDEHYLSAASKRINDEIVGKKSRLRRLFSWDEWQKYINRLIWFSGEIDYSTNLHSRQEEFCNFGEPGSFSKFAWTEGIWRLGNFNSVETQGILESQCFTFAKKVLDAQNTTVDAQINQPCVNRPTLQPIYETIEQFVNSCEGDSRFGHLVQVGRELLDINFSNCFFNFSEVDILKQELLKCGSDLKIVTSIPQESSERDDLALVFIPQSLQCSQMIDLKITSALKCYPSKSMEWLIAISSLFFEVNEIELMKTLKLYRRIYPKK